MCEVWGILQSSWGNAWVLVSVFWAFSSGSECWDFGSLCLCPNSGGSWGSFSLSVCLGPGVFPEEGFATELEDLGVHLGLRAGFCVIDPAASVSVDLWSHRTWCGTVQKGWTCQPQSWWGGGACATFGWSSGMKPWCWSVSAGWERGRDACWYSRGQHHNSICLENCTWVPSYTLTSFTAKLSLKPCEWNLFHACHLLQLKHCECLHASL